ncbi:UPF0146 family protein [Halorubrum ejinorense]|uniref:UPF0146 family protein n=1 Tax=Halorubrum ejinorense TaxID=425309 RepID=A0AAV3SSY2_9EURY
MVPPTPSGRALADALDGYGRLIEVGVGRRPGVARALAERGCDVIAVDVEVGEAAREAASETRASGEGRLRVVEADVTTLAADDRALRRALGLGTGGRDGGGADARDGGGTAPNATGVDAVYARNLPAELQRPTVALADRLDAACVFTTLGFEEPIVDVGRRTTASGTVTYVAR